MDILPIRILLCDDNPDDQALTRRFLRRACPHAEIVAVSDGEQAVAKLIEVAEGREPQPVLVVLDYRMPKLRGDEVLRSVRRLDRIREIPFVLFCSDIVPREVDECREAGIDLFIQKPSEYEGYEEAVRNMIGRFVDATCLPSASVS
ncbi:response regulator [bacterium]|nr:MAG: response regulator [bacterium]